MYIMYINIYIYLNYIDASFLSFSRPRVCRILVVHGVRRGSRRQKRGGGGGSFGAFHRWLIVVNHWLIGFQSWGTPKSSILIGFSTIDRPFWGTPIYGNPRMRLGIHRSQTFVGIFFALAKRCLIIDG